MTRILTAALALAVTLPGVALAVTQADLTDAVRTQITEALTAEGYEVRQIETEDGYFEAYALKDGVRYEIYLDADLQIVRAVAD